jgi:hypothetical protein
MLRPFRGPGWYSVRSITGVWRHSEDASGNLSGRLKVPKALTGPDVATSVATNRPMGLFRSRGRVS